MTAREYLQRAWQIDGRIGRRLEERARLRTMLNAGASASDEGPREAESALIAMDEAIEGEILALCRVKREVNAAIEAVDDVRLRRLLELRYRSYMTWEAIADEMGYELRHIYRLHREALRRVERGFEGTLEDVG